jgi:hypothetical protein
VSIAREVIEFVRLEICGAQHFLSSCWLLCDVTLCQTRVGSSTAGGLLFCTAIVDLAVLLLHNSHFFKVVRCLRQYVVINNEYKWLCCNSVISSRASRFHGCSKQHLCLHCWLLYWCDLCQTRVGSRTAGGLLFHRAIGNLVLSWVWCLHSTVDCVQLALNV